VVLSVVGCRTPVKPLTVPVANLYPTLNPSSILAGARSVKVAEGDLSALLAHLGALGPLKAHGMGPGEMPLVLRGLERHGYAEIDARRTPCPVRWVVLRGITEESQPRLVVEIGFTSAPSAAEESGINLTRPGTLAPPRRDAYGRVSLIEAWRSHTERADIEVRHISPPGGGEYWELEYRIPCGKA
jgi:hypothetical protein